MPSETPRIDPRLAALLGRVWPGLPAAATRTEAMGFAWAAVSTPFVRREGERVVGHVGVIELPLVMARCRIRQSSGCSARLAGGGHGVRRLGDGFEAEPWDAARAAAHGDAAFAGLMARGPLAVDGGSFMLPR